MLSPESANFSPLSQQDPDDADGGSKEPSEVTEFEAMSYSVDPEVSSGIDTIDSRFLRQSALPRYKVGLLSGPKKVIPQF